VESVFVVENFQVDTMSVSPNLISERWFLLPDLEVLNEVYLLGRVVQHESHHWGSPPFPETETRLLDFDKIDSRLAPARGEGSLMTFYVRLSQAVSLEETAYWMPSILDLFGAWGAIASFLTTLSLGLAARLFNRRGFRKSFSKAVARLSGAEQDIRLYDREHFDQHGRLIMTAAELKTPTSVFGELRSFASQEHRRKAKATNMIHLSWLQRRREQGRVAHEQWQRGTVESRLEPCGGTGRAVDDDDLCHPLVAP